MFEDFSNKIILQEKIPYLLLTYRLYWNLRHYFLAWYKIVLDDWILYKMLSLYLAVYIHNFMWECIWLYLSVFFWNIQRLSTGSVLDLKWGSWLTWTWNNFTIIPEDPNAV